MEFVTRKVTYHAARIKKGLAQGLELGNLDASRDWGFAGDYVKAMWLMLQAEAPGDFVIGSGRAHTVRQLVEAAFEYVGLDWQDHVTTSEGLFRPAEVDHLVADASRAREELAWSPIVDFEALIHMMVDADLEQAGTEEG